MNAAPSIPLEKVDLNCESVIKIIKYQTAKSRDAFQLGYESADGMAKGGRGWNTCVGRRPDHLLAFLMSGRANVEGELGEFGWFCG